MKTQLESWGSSEEDSWSQDGDGYTGCELVVRNQCSPIQTSDISPVKIQPNILPGSTYKNKVGSVLGIKTCSVSCAFSWGLQFAPQIEPITPYQVENHTKLVLVEAFIHGLLKAEQIFMTGLVLVWFGVLIVITIKWREWIVFLLWNKKADQNYEQTQRGTWMKCCLLLCNEHGTCW